MLSKRAVAITQDLMKARDKRIGVMSELIPAIQFIKASLANRKLGIIADSYAVLRVDWQVEEAGHGRQICGDEAGRAM